MIKKIIFSVCILAGLWGCRKEAPDQIDPRNVEINNWNQLFESFWQGMNTNYVLWSVDNTDWDEIYYTYKPRFQRLEKYGFFDKDRNDEAAGWMEEVVANLVDHHFNLKIDLSNYTKDGEYQIQNKIPSEKLQGLEQKYVLRYLALKRNRYNMTQYKFAENSDRVFFASGLINQNIVYVSMNGFELSPEIASYKDLSSNEGKIAESYKNYRDLIRRSDVRGIIFDFRTNLGGYQKDFDILFSPLFSGRVLTGYNKHKVGLGRYDLSPWTAQYMEGIASSNFDKPIIVLSDKYSVSMAEFSTSFIKNLPNGHFLGERTYGATCGYVPDNLAASYKLSGYFKNRVMECITVAELASDVNKQVNEGVGITPDIQVDYDETRMRSGVDVQLNRAVEYLQSL